MFSRSLSQPLCGSEFETHSPEDLWLVSKKGQDFQNIYHRTIIRCRLFRNFPLSIEHKCLFSMQFHPNALLNDLDHERLSKSKDKASLRKISSTLGERITIKSDSDKLETFPEDRIKFHSALCKVLGKKSLIKYRMRNYWFLPGRILELCWITRWAGVNNVSLWWKGESPSWDV